MTITLTDATPRINRPIGGVILSIPQPFAEGHVLTANEAASMNQTYLENVGNNFRSKVTGFKKVAITGKENPSKAELDAVTDKQVDDFTGEVEKDQSLLPIEKIQAEFEALVAGYQMNVRRAGAGTSYTPEEKAARSIAKDKLKTALVKRGTKLNTVSADWWEREISRLLDKENPVVKGDKNVTEDIWKTAERQVKLLQAAAADGLDDIMDMSGLTESANGNGAAESEPETETTEEPQTEAAQ